MMPSSPSVDLTWGDGQVISLICRGIRTSERGKEHLG